MNLINKNINKLNEIQLRPDGGKHWLKKEFPKIHHVLDLLGFQPDFSNDTSQNSKETVYIPKGSNPIKEEGDQFFISREGGWEPHWEHWYDGECVASEIDNNGNILPEYEGLPVYKQIMKYAKTLGMEKLPKQEEPKLLNELLGMNLTDIPYEYKKIENELNSRRYNYCFTTDENEKYDVIIDCAFKKAYIAFFKNVWSDFYDAYLQTTSLKPTSLKPTNNYIKILTTVVNICKEFHNHYDVKLWEFSARKKEASRVKTYSLLTKMLAKKIGFVYDIFNADDNVYYFLYENSEIGNEIAANNKKQILGIYSDGY